MKFEQTHKDLISYLIACIMVLSGIVLAYFSFFILHLIENSILGFISLGITFAGAIFGITQILRDKFKAYEVSTNKAIIKKLKEQGEDKKEDSD
nr:MAG TPA: SPP1 phage holin [Caudoviricetes sp.]